MRHTEAPWSVSDQYMEVPGRYVVGPNNELVADGWPDTPMNFALPEKSDVRGNMQITAAALDLLKACKALLKAYAPKADWSKPDELHSAVKAAGAAIAKAERKV